MKTKVIAIALLLLSVFVGGAQAATMLDVPFLYSAVETRARIIDEQTGQPVEGAVVVAQWILRGYWASEYTLHIAEAVTDQNGEFVIPAWGPKPRWPDTALKHFSPQLLIFKHGYKPLWLHNEAIADVAKYVPNYKTMKTKHLIANTNWLKGAPFDSVQRSMWKGLNIEIERFSGTSDRWLDLLIDFLRFIREENDKELPGLFQSLAAERSYFKANPISKYPWHLLNFFDRVDAALK